MNWNADVWQQGGLMPAKAIPESQRGESSSDFYMILSHDCDLHRSSDKEPFVELLPCHYTEEQDKSLLYGSNPRSLQLVYVFDGKEYPFILNAHQKLFIRKEDIDCSQGSQLLSLKIKRF